MDIERLNEVAKYRGKVLDQIHKSDKLSIAIMNLYGVVLLSAYVLIFFVKLILIYFFDKEIVVYETLILGMALFVFVSMYVFRKNAFKYMQDSSPRQKFFKGLQFVCIGPILINAVQPLRVHEAIYNNKEYWQYVFVPLSIIVFSFSVYVALRNSNKYKKLLKFLDNLE